MKWGIALLMGLLVGCGRGMPPTQSGDGIQRVGQIAADGQIVENRVNQNNDEQAPVRAKQIWERLATHGQFSFRWEMTITEDRLILELGCEKGAVSDYLVGSASIQIGRDTIFVGEDIRLESQTDVFAGKCVVYLPAGIYEYDVSLSELVLHSNPSDLVFYRF